MNIRWLAAALLVLLAGCGRSTPCASGTERLPEAWAALPFPAADDPMVCAYDDRHGSIAYGGMDYREAIDAHRAAFEDAGWRVSPFRSETMAFDADRDSLQVTLQFFECNKYLARPPTWFTCTRADVRIYDHYQPGPPADSLPGGVDLSGGAFRLRHSVSRRI